MQENYNFGKYFSNTYMMTSTNIQNSNLILEYDIYVTHFLEAGVSTLTDVAVNTNLALKKANIESFGQ